MRTTVEPLEGNKVKLSVEVDEREFERDLEAAFRRISREVRIPGFRPGKVPRRLLEARLGTEAARQEALRESLPGYYARALSEEDVDAIAPPEIDITAGQTDGPVVFDAVVEVRPRISVPGYGGLRVEVPSPEVTEADVDVQVDRLRQQGASLEPVERPASDGDFVRMDVAGTLGGEEVEGLTADDYVHQVGSGTALPEIDVRLLGAKVGDILAFDAEHPDEDEERPVSLRILVKDVQRQLLPEATDAWVGDNSEFATLTELRDDLRHRIEAAKRSSSVMALQQGTLSALVDLVDEDPPDALVDAEVERRGRELVSRLGAQGIDLQTYLEATGGPGALSEQLRTQAVGAVKGDLALRSVADAESIEVDDDDLDTEVARVAASVGQSASTLRRALERNDQLASVRSELRKSKALTWLSERAEVVDPEGKPVGRALLEPPTDQPADLGAIAPSNELPAPEPAEERAE